MSKYFKNFLDEQLKDEEFRKEHESLEAEFQIIKEIVEARKDKKYHTKGIVRLNWNNTRRYK